jgi:hypothetical protein
MSIELVVAVSTLIAETGKQLGQFPGVVPTSIAPPDKIITPFVLVTSQLTSLAKDPETQLVTSITFPEEAEKGNALKFVATVAESTTTTPFTKTSTECPFQLSPKESYALKV